ncbi:hypothetical protein [Nostoc piscinale]|uniref:hypothetical protein n=1 Tax=Nostoc piscinale TaxID=224012 RepID=UPI001F1CCCDC|nr:hypothetical protein [Nostoc piscinale]
MNKITVNDIQSTSFPQGDYVSPGLETIQPDLYFPNMVLGNKYDSSWLYLRRDIPHTGMLISVGLMWDLSAVMKHIFSTTPP